MFDPVRNLTEKSNCAEFHKTPIFQPHTKPDPKIWLPRIHKTLNWSLVLALNLSGHNSHI